MRKKQRSTERKAKSKAHTVKKGKNQIKILFNRLIKNEPSIVLRVKDKMNKEEARDKDREADFEESKDQAKDEVASDGDDFFGDVRREKDERSSIEVKPQYLVSDWLNSVLVLVSVRLGLKKV